jgi:hypothetical protein
LERLPRDCNYPDAVAEDQESIRPPNPCDDTGRQCRNCGYGAVAGAAAEKALPAGSFYTEPAGVAHFAETKADPVLVYITGNGPTDTVYVKASDEPGVK